MQRKVILIILIFLLMMNSLIGVIYAEDETNLENNIEQAEQQNQEVEQVQETTSELNDVSQNSKIENKGRQYFVLGTIIGIVFIGPIPTFNIIHLPIIIISFILAIFINSLIRMIISIISFWIEDSEPFHWIYDKFILIFGTLFPIEMFPKFIRPIMECTPIFVVNYGPIKLIIDFTIEKCTQIIIAQILYLIIVISLILILYNKGVKKLNVNGG